MWRCCSGTDSCFDFGQKKKKSSEEDEADSCPVQVKLAKVS